MSSFKPDGIDVLVQAREFHCAANTERLTHRRHGYTRLGADGTNVRKLTRPGQCEAVSFARLDGNSQAQLARESRRPGAAAHDEFVRFNFLAIREFDGANATVRLGCKIEDLAFPGEFHVEPLKLRLQRGHEAVGREMAIQGKVNRAGDIHARAGIERGGLFRVENFRRNAERAGLRGHFGFFVECGLLLAEHEQALFHEAEICIRERGEFLEARAAGQAEIAYQRCGTANMF